MSTPKTTGELNPALAAALALVDFGPVRSEEWFIPAQVMCDNCQPGEDVDQAAARILAAEVRRLRAVIEEGMAE